MFKTGSGGNILRAEAVDRTSLRCRHTAVADYERRGHIVSGEVPVGIWAVFVAFVLGMLALDLGVFHRKTHTVKLKESLLWSCLWIGLALTFNLGIYLFWNRISPNSSYSRTDAAAAFLTGYLIEKALSIDNLFVFVMLFQAFAVPSQLQHKALFWGILGALLFRAVFIAAGAALLAHFSWMVAVFGALLLFTGINMLGHKQRHIDPNNSRMMRTIRKFVPVTDAYVGNRMVVKIAGKWLATPLLLTLIAIELTDILFALDSIPAIFAVTRDPFIVFTSNVFAILGLRSLYFALSGLANRFTYLGFGLAVVLMFVGSKMLWTFYQHTFVDHSYSFPTWLSLVIIFGVLVCSIVASLLRPARQAKASSH